MPEPNHILATVEGVSVLSFPRLTAAGCTHGFTLRSGGVSASPFDTLNLGWNRPEPRENIEQNYRILCRAFDLSREALTLCSYCHGDGVERADREHRGWGFPDRPRFADCDALVTDDAALTLVSLHADCMPVFLYDPQKNAGAMIHAGWKGVSLSIGKKAAQKLVREYGCDPKNILAGLGPSICPACFEIDAPVADVFRAAFPSLPIAWDGQKYHVDLHEAMRLQLNEAGLPDVSIEVAHLCTAHDPGFFSFRRDKKTHGATGAMAGFLRVRKN